jgi:serine/threonine protein kinase
VNIVGFGSYGEVKLAKNTENNEVVAIKMVVPPRCRSTTRTRRRRSTCTTS